MENRRQHYRHEFAPSRQIAVRLESAKDLSAVQGELVNLSIGGMCVYAPALQTDTAKKWVVTLALETGAAPLSLEAERVSIRNGERACCGFHFVQAGDLQAMEDREKVIWKFLLDEQRRRRRFLQGG